MTATPTVVTATPLATMSPQESDGYVEKLLQSNGECSLPCVWGLTPGQTSYVDAQQFFRSLGWMGNDTHGYYSTGKDMQGFPLAIRVGVQDTDSIVKRMHIGIGGNGFQDKVEFFSFQNILETLGKPSDILAFVGTSPGAYEPNETSFDILLYYSDKNTLAEYVGTAVSDGDKYRICPSQPNAESTQADPLSGNVSIYTADASETITPEELVRPFWILPDYYLSVEQAFGISVDEFYDTVSQGNGNACFESPLAAWER